MNIVALADGDREHSLRTIFHEYVHVVIDNLSQAMPVWLNEGLAEYYSTFQVDEGGRRAVVGRLIPSHLQLLNERRHLSIAELLAVETSSASYNEGERQTLFYAQSWALVHMLVSGARIAPLCWRSTAAWSPMEHRRSTRGSRSSRTRTSRANSNVTSARRS